MASNKDADGVVKFLVLLAELKDRCDDEPGRLRAVAESNKATRELCNQLSWAAHFLKMNERRHRELFTAPVDPKFLTDWRDFEERFESVLLDISFADFLGGLEPTETIQSRGDMQWEFADDMAREQASAIEEAIDFARDQASQEYRDFSEGFREGIHAGMTAWERLKHEVGFDMRGIFRRRELIPFVLVPRHVAARYGSAEVVSLFRSLQQAHDAFIFGALFAAIGLMRSIMESTLRDHYGVSGSNLQERMRNADGFLPPLGNAVALDRLRKLANAVLHSKERDEAVPEIENAQLEKEIVSLLYALRALIENVPRDAARPRS